MRQLALALMIALPACAPGVPTAEPAGEIRYGDTSYPILARGDDWFVQVEGRPVACRAATEEDCYWSLRAHLRALKDPELIQN
jgi:hypothetical protein